MVSPEGTHAAIVPFVIIFAPHAEIAARYVGAPVVVAVGLRGASVTRWSVCLTDEAERHQASHGGGGIATRSPPWPAATPATCLAPANDGY